MKILIIGGTQFVGRHLTEIALAQGHEVTHFNRGKTNPTLFPEVEKLQGDRDGNLKALENRIWDAVVDTCGYVPRVVRQSVELLKNAVNHYTFISSISVYPDLDTKVNEDENGNVLQLDDPTIEEITGETYGALKALCEKVVEVVMPHGALNIRPGFIVGPFDPTFRFSYWLSRMAMGGEMLAPSSPDYQVQFIDGRDLAAWILRMVEQQQTGTFNATGHPTRLGDILDISKAQAGSDTELTWVSSDFLKENEAQLPLWFPDEWVGVHRVNIQRAVDAGLTFRPVEDIIRDTYAWLNTIKVDNPLKSGISREEEAKLLQKWHELGVRR